MTGKLTHLRLWWQQLQANPESVSKYAMAAEITARVNENPESNEFLRIRRELIRRIVETRAFDHCWPNDQQAARAFVASIREYVNERDFFTKTIDATEKLQQLKREEHRTDVKQKEQRTATREALRARFYALFAIADGHRRGYEFQKFLSDLFAFEGVRIREPFTVGTAEQIDGAIMLDNHLYLVEAKWWADRLGHKEVSDLYIKVSGRPVRPRGLCISGSGFTDECLDVCKQARISEVVFMTAEDIVSCFERGVQISDLIRRKAEFAMTEGRIFIAAHEILERTG